MLHAMIEPDLPDEIFDLQVGADQLEEAGGSQVAVAALRAEFERKASDYRLDSARHRRGKQVEELIQEVGAEALRAMSQDERQAFARSRGINLGDRILHAQGAAPSIYISIAMPMGNGGCFGEISWTTEGEHLIRRRGVMGTEHRVPARKGGIQ